LNRYPFAAGHLLVVPHAHVDALEALPDDVHDALFRLVRESVARLRRAVRPEGVNVGCNLGEAAGAGVKEHLHVHVVPRWSGDTNFMPVLADTRVVPQALDETREHLLPYFSDIPGNVGGAETPPNPRGHDGGAETPPNPRGHDGGAETPPNPPGRNGGAGAPPQGTAA